MRKIVPPDSRYVPFTQQAECCAPTCIQMVMYRNGIPLVPAEELGYYLGLVVPPSEARLFYKPRASKTMPAGGYGTRILVRGFSPEDAFKKLGIPLTFTLHKVAEFASARELLDFLVESEKSNRDVVFCFNHGALVGDPSRDLGHLVLFDRAIKGRLRIIDPSPSYPKWRLVGPGKMLYAMRRHSEKAGSAGLWEFRRKKRIAYHP